MRVLIHAAVDLSLAGGLETHVRELALGLMERGHTVEIFGRPERCEPFRMVSRIEPARYDVIHHHGGRWPRGLDPGLAYVRTFHFSVAAKMRRYLGLGRIQTLANVPNWRALADERWSARRARAVIAVSRKLAGEISRLHGVARERIHVIPNGACFDPPAEPRQAVRARWGVPRDARVLLTIGRRDFVKGYGLLERAWRRVRVPDAVWVQVGGGHGGSVPRHVATGDVARRDAIAWIHAADAGAFPSWYEGGGIVLLDFLAGGLYALTHDVGNAFEVIRERENGEIVPPDPAAWAAALERALGAPRRPSGGLPVAFRWERVVDRVQEVYRSCEGER